MDCTPKAEISDRISCFQKKLISNNIDGAIIILNSDMFYFTGTVQNSFLYIPAENDPVLMVKRSLRRGIEESQLKNIVPIAHPKQIPEILSEFGYTGFKKIGLELDVLPVNIYKMYSKSSLRRKLWMFQTILKNCAV
jgi:Xaa-Pro aminopeptidase